jgi:hypothetical protein
VIRSNVFLYHVIPAKCFIPCDTLRLIYTLWSRGIKQIESITWHITDWKYHMVIKRKFVEGITSYEQFEDITWYETVWGYPVLYHVIRSNVFLYHVIPAKCFIPCDTLRLIYTLWYIQTLLCHMIPWKWLIICDTLKRFHTMWYLQIVHTMWYLQQNMI